MLKGVACPWQLTFSAVFFLGDTHGGRANLPQTHRFPDECSGPRAVPALRELGACSGIGACEGRPLADKNGGHLNKIPCFGEKQSKESTLINSGSIDNSEDVCERWALGQVGANLCHGAQTQPLLGVSFCGPPFWSVSFSSYSFTLAGQGGGRPIPSVWDFQVRIGKVGRTRITES